MRHRDLHSFPTRRSSDLNRVSVFIGTSSNGKTAASGAAYRGSNPCVPATLPSNTRTIQCKNNTVRRPTMNRRGFFQRGVHLAAASALAVHSGATWAQGKVVRTGGVKLKLGLNAYSFDRPLRAGEMTLEDLVVYCAQNGFDALDATGYYFPGYPKVPSDDTIRSLKKKAYLNGVTLSSTGVRNDFSLPDAARRKQEVQLVKDWTVVRLKSLRLNSS